MCCRDGPPCYPLKILLLHKCVLIFALILCFLLFLVIHSQVVTKECSNDLAGHRLQLEIITEYINCVLCLLVFTLISLMKTGVL